MILVCSFTLFIALEMKFLQKAGLPTGMPNTRIQSVISCGAPSLVEFSFIMHSKSSPVKRMWGPLDSLSRSISFCLLVDTMTLFFFFKYCSKGEAQALEMVHAKGGALHVDYHVDVVHVAHDNGDTPWVVIRREPLLEALSVAVFCSLHHTSVQFPQDMVQHCSGKMGERGHPCENPSSTSIVHQSHLLTSCPLTGLWRHKTCRHMGGGLGNLLL